MLILTRQENKISWFYEARGFDGVVSMNNYRHEEVKVSRQSLPSASPSAVILQIFEHCSTGDVLL